MLDTWGRLSVKAMIVIAVSAHVALIWAWPYPPILDWPNHMARHYLEARALAGATLPSGYEINYALTPNLGSDLTVPLLLQVFPLTVASRLFLTFNVLVCWLGFSLFVARQAAKSGKEYGASLPLLVMPLLLTATFLYGFLNYTSGVGLAFLIFINYLRLSDKEHVHHLQLACHALLITLLYFWHLAAFGIYGILHASHLSMYMIKHWPSVVPWRKNSRKALDGLIVLLPVGILILIRKLTATLSALDGAIVWHDPIGKGSSAIASLFTYNIPLDIVAIALWIAAAVTMVRVKMQRLVQLDWLHLATFMFLIAYIALPGALGTTSYVDVRALPPFWICCVALIARLPVRQVIAGSALALGATLVHVGTIHASWTKFSRIQAPYSDFIQQLPVGARILGAMFPDISRFNNDAHLIAWAVPERQAMVSTLFAYAGQQPLTVSVKGMGPFYRITRDWRMEFDVERVRAGSFDYVWCFNPFGRAVVVPADWVHVYSASSITVWRIR